MNEELSTNRQQKAIVLNVIKKYGPVSRGKTKHITGIRLGTIGAVVKELKEENLLSENYLTRKNFRGRRKGLLEINPEGRYTVGIELTQKGILGILLNLGGDILKEKVTPVSKKSLQKDILEKIVITVSQLLKGISKKKKIAGIGFVDPGLIDSEKGISLYSTVFPVWKNVPVKKLLEEKFNLPVFLSNTPQAKALAEYHFGQAKGMKDFVFIEYGEGIACGIYSGGKLIRGNKEIAGEFGHTTIQGETTVCKCGKKGCLESLVSFPAITKKVMQILKKDKLHPHPEINSGQALSSPSCRGRIHPTRSGLINQAPTKEIPEREKENSYASKLTIEMIFKSFEEGNKDIRKILEKLIFYLSLGISNLVNILNPEMIILDPAFQNTGKCFIETLVCFINREVLKENRENLKIVVSELGEKIGALGGSALVLDDIFTLPEFKI